MTKIVLSSYDLWKTRSPDDDIWQEETDNAEHLIAFVPGDRVISRRGERATVVARNATTPPDCTPVVYDNDNNVTIWNCTTDLLRLLGEDE